MRGSARALHCANRAAESPARASTACRSPAALPRARDANRGALLCCALKYILKTEPRAAIYLAIKFMLLVVRAANNTRLSTATASEGLAHGTPSSVAQQGEHVSDASLRRKCIAISRADLGRQLGRS